MADNFVCNAGSGGSTFVGASLTFSGDTAITSGVFQLIISGSEGSWTAAQIVGGAGAVAAGVQRVTLASDDPAVTALQVIDDLVSTNGSGTPSKGVCIMGSDGTNPQIIACSAAGVLSVAAICTATNLDIRDLTSASDSVAAVQSGTWNITNVSGTVSLPTGAATAAKQPALGTAGSPSSDVISIQGVASGTVVPVSDGGGTLTVDGTVAVSGSVAVTGTFWQATQPVSIAATVAVNTEFPSAETITDAFSNPTTPPVMAMLMGWNGASWDRIVSEGSVGDGETVTTKGAIATEAYNMMYNGSTWDRIRGNTTDGLTVNLGTNNDVTITSGTITTITNAVTVNSHAVTNAGTFVVQENGSALTSLQIMDDWDSSDDCRKIEQGAAIMDGATRCTVKRFMVVTSTDGADLIAAVADKKFRILSFAIFATATTATAFWLEDSDGADVFGDSTGITLDIDGGSGPAGLVLNHNPYGWWQTATANKDLHIKLTAAQKVVVSGTYIEVS